LQASLKGFFKPSKEKIVVFLLVFFFAPFPAYDCIFIDDSLESPFCRFSLLPFMVPVLFFIAIEEAQIYSVIYLSLYPVVSYVSGCFSAWFVARRGKKDFIAIGLTVLWLYGYYFMFSTCIDGSTTVGICYDPWDVFVDSLGPVVLFGSIYTAFRIWKYRKSKIGVLITICLIPLYTILVFTPSHPEYVGTGFDENELYEFSFETPMNWRYIESHQSSGGRTDQVVYFPNEFNPESLGESEQPGLLNIFSGLPIAYDSPQILIQFEKITESKIPQLNSQELEKYEIGLTRLFVPGSIGIDKDSESTSWGWIVSSKGTISGRGESIQYIVEGKTFYFKDRESYAVVYVAPDYYFDAYYPVYENVFDTLVIKGVVVP